MAVVPLVAVFVTDPTVGSPLVAPLKPPTVPPLLFMPEKLTELTVVPRQAQASFQDEHLNVTAWNIFHHDRRAGNGSSDRCGMNFSAAQSLRHLEEHRPFLQRHVARSRLETEKCLCPNSRERVVLEKQLRPRSCAGLQA